MTTIRAAAVTPSAVLGRVRRTLLVDVDGRRDTTTDVVWLQGPVLYVDLRIPAAPGADRRAAAALRGPEDLAGAPDAVVAHLLAHEGFAGRFHLDGERARWERLVDVRPPTGVPDEGTLERVGDLLVETGTHAPYVEHWLPEGVHGVRGGDGAGVLPDDEAASAAGGAAGVLLVEEGTGRTGVLVRVGSLFGVARGRVLPLPVGADLRALSAAVPPADLLDCEVALGRVGPDGRWVVEASTLPWRTGADLAPSEDGDRLTTADTGPSGPVTRTWRVVERHGPVDLVPPLPTTVPTLARTGGSHGIE